MSNLIPTMTSNTAPSPNVAAASSERVGTYEAYRAFNRSTATFWSTLSDSQAPSWLSFSFGEGIRYIVTEYTMQNRSIEYGSTPKDWTFEGWDRELAEWVVLDTQVDETGWAANEIRNYPFSNADAYDTFRFNITANNGSSYTTIVTSEFYGTQEPLEAPSKVTGASPADEATDVSRASVELSWSASTDNHGGATITYDVYFGTSESLVTAGNAGVLVSDGQAGLSYDVGKLYSETTYYWRVDAVNTAGTTAGDVWSFTTDEVSWGSSQLSPAIRSRLLDHLFTKATFTAPSTIKVALATAGGTEFAGGDYARVSTTAVDWTFALGGVLTNASTVNFPTPSAEWGLAGRVLLYDENDVLFASVTLETLREVLAGQAPNFAAGDISIAITGPFTQVILNSILDHLFGKGSMVTIPECWPALALADDSEPEQAAAGTLTMDTLPTDGDMVTVDTTTYRFKDTTAQANDIQIGATVDEELAETQANLIAAIEGTGSEGVEYHAGTTAPHPSVGIGAFNLLHEAIVMALVAGSSGNSIATTSSFTAGTNGFDDTTLGTTIPGGNVRRPHMEPADWVVDAGVAANAHNVEWDQQTSNWGDVAKMFIYDAETAGNALAAQNLTAPRAVNLTVPKPEFLGGNLKISIS